MIEIPTIATMPRTMQLRLMARWELARRDPMYFFRYFAFTNKPEGRLNVVTPFPADRPHIMHLTRLWQENPLLAICKSRQMIVTWWASGLLVWDGLFHDNRLLMAQAKRQDDAIGDEHTGDGLLGRAKFMLRHIPLARALGVEADIRSDMIVFPRRHSTIWAIPQGAAIIRQRTASGIVSDEAAFQEEFEDAVTASLPAVRSGGWFLAISTADLTDGGFFHRLVADLPDPE